MTKTPHVLGYQTMAQNPFNRLRWGINEIEGKWDAIARGLEFIRTCTDLKKAREKAAETLQIMAREDIKA